MTEFLIVFLLGIAWIFGYHAFEDGLIKCWRDAYPDGGNDVTAPLPTNGLARRAGEG